MRAKVFISCGQATDEEKAISKEIDHLLDNLGYEPYVAIRAQTILDINQGIIDELKSSDMYLLVNFKREQLKGEGEGGRHRGSLFSNQELAIAYALNFEKLLILNEKGVKREGVLAYMAANTPEFQSYDDVLPTLCQAVEDARWSPEYSRQLTLVSLPSTPDYMTYSDGTGHRHERIFRCAIRNRRPDCGALHTMSRLTAVWTSAGQLLETNDRSQLKAVGYPGYEQVIWPDSEGQFDLFGIEQPSQAQAPRVFLHSALDLHPRSSIIKQPGEYRLEFEVFSEGFPKLAFAVKLSLPQDPLEAAATIVETST